MKPIKNFCLPHKLGLVMSDASAEVHFLHNEFQPDSETMFRFISNSAVRHDAMAQAFKDLELQEVAIFARSLPGGSLTGVAQLICTRVCRDCSLD